MPIFQGLWPGLFAAAPASGSASGGLLYFSETKNWRNGGAPVYGSSADYDFADAYTTNIYSWSDGPLQAWVELDNRDGVTTSQYSYDRDFRLTDVKLTGGTRPRDVSFASNAGGQILTRSEADNNASQNDPSSRSYFFAGQKQGEVSNNGTENVTYATWIANRTNVDGTGAPCSCRRASL